MIPVGSIVEFDIGHLGRVMASYLDSNGESIYAVQSVKDPSNSHFWARYRRTDQLKVVGTLPSNIDPENVPGEHLELYKKINGMIRTKANANIKAAIDYVRDYEPQPIPRITHNFKRGDFIHWCEWNAIITDVYSGDYGTVLEVYWAKNAMQRQGVEYFPLDGGHNMPVHSTRDAFMAEVMTLHARRLMDIASVFNAVLGEDEPFGVDKRLPAYLRSGPMPTTPANSITQYTTNEIARHAASSGMCGM